MQTLTLDLPTPVLLVWGLPEDAKVTDNNTISYRLPKCGVMHYTHLPEGNWQLIGKLSELTEEQYEGLVEVDKENWWKDYMEKDPEYYPFVFVDAEGSFYSAIEAEGYHVENPIPKPTPCGCMGPCGLVCRYEMWQDAESKTLPANTLIFKRV